MKPPLRTVTNTRYDPQTPGRGMLQDLECGHTLRKPRRSYNFTRTRVRCPICEHWLHPQEDR